MFAPELFRASVHLVFTDAELGYLRRPIVGDGGHQRWLRELHGRIAKKALDITHTELHKTEHYAYDYGSGGYQDAFKAVLRAAFRAGWRGDD